MILPHKAPALARGGRQSERLRTGWRGRGETLAAWFGLLTQPGPCLRGAAGALK
ncbi:Hypothetical Protein RSKD131_0350 [Cereibacter sphaeroides KD131]|nr:Hypothetical Protein RSKD131_0350 [Cereibacter sphaeroides KD131]